MAKQHLKRMQAMMNAPKLIGSENDGNYTPPRINNDDNVEDILTKPTRLKPLAHLASMLGSDVMSPNALSRTYVSPQ
jgi:hypothetical protein